MKDVDGAISKLFIEPEKCTGYISLLEQKRLRGAQTPNRNEAEAHLGLWGLPAPQVQESLQWGVCGGADSDALRMVLFFLLKSFSYVIKHLVRKSVLDISACVYVG